MLYFTNMVLLYRHTYMYTDLNLESIQNSTFYALKFHSASTHIIYDY